jgi:hypothetical protein
MLFISATREISNAFFLRTTQGKVSIRLSSSDPEHYHRPVGTFGASCLLVISGSCVQGSSSVDVQFPSRYQWTLVLQNFRSCRIEHALKHGNSGTAVPIDQGMPMSIEG